MLVNVNVHVHVHVNVNDCGVYMYTFVLEGRVLTGIFPTRRLTSM